ncbi:hypothetical protein HDU78_006686 [Chytriomyces hyalinus]|nr:hypothetical protein HDU78_006686 [Chytriomyces hyalinus]
MSEETAMADSILSSLVNTHLVRDAGFDSHGRRVFVFYSCFLPDPSVVSYDDLMRALVARLDAFVDSGYVLIVFASGSRHRPSLVWMLRAYRLLARKFRKNLMRLVIVHPSPWFQLLMQVFGPVISPKFTAKVSWVDNTQILNESIPAAQIFMPRILKEIDKKRIAESKHEGHKQTAPPEGILSSIASWAISLTGLSSSSLPFPTATPTGQFGVSLDILMGPHSENGLPRVVSDCMRFILAHGLETEGLFRVSPSLPSVLRLKEQYNNNAAEIDFEAHGGVHSACGLLKLFFRELPTPIFEASMYDTIRTIQSFSDTTETTQTTIVKTALLPILPQNTFTLLRALFQLLHMIHLNHTKTLMHSGNLAIVWAPNFVKSANPMIDLGMCAVGTSGGGVGTLVKICIERWEEVFEAEMDGSSGNVDGSGSGSGEQLDALRSSDNAANVAPPGAAAADRPSNTLSERSTDSTIVESVNTANEDADARERSRFNINRRPSKSLNQIQQASESSPTAIPIFAFTADSNVKKEGDPLVSVDSLQTLPAPRARSRTPSPMRGRPNTVVAAEDSAIARIGGALSNTTLAKASSSSPVADAMFRKL